MIYMGEEPLSMPHKTLREFKQLHIESLLSHQNLSTNGKDLHELDVDCDVSPLLDDPEDLFPEAGRPNGRPEDAIQ
jgi:hypothetical protein